MTIEQAEKLLMQLQGQLKLTKDERNLIEKAIATLVELASKAP